MKESAVDFAFNRFGKKVAPDSKTSWLSKPGRLLKDSPKKKAGEPNSGMAGTSVYISDSEVRIFGPDYAEFGFPAIGGSGEARLFAMRKLLQEPTERWLMVSFAKTSVLSGHLHLNCPGDKETAYFVGKDFVRMRFGLIRTVAEAFMKEGVSSKSSAELIHRFREHLSGEPASEWLSKKLTAHSQLMPVMLVFIESGMPPSQIELAMEFYKETQNV